jgi:hypothetical protein
MSKQFSIQHIFLLLVLAVNILPAKAHFTTKGPYGGSVTCLLATDTQVFIGTANGGVFRSTSAAVTSWHYANYSGLLNGSVNSLASMGQYTLAGTNGGIFKSNDAGNSWNVSNSGLSNQTVLSLIAAGDHIIAGTNGGGIYLSHDSGSTWEQSNVGLTNLIVTAFAFDGIAIYAATHAGVFSSVDEGDSWTPINSGLSDLSTRSIAVSGNNILVATASGIFVSDRSTISWTQQSTGLGSTTVNNLAVTNGIIYAATSNGIYTSPDQQNITWTEANNGYEGNVTSSAVYNGKLFAGTREDGIYRSLSLSSIAWSEFNSGFNNLETYAIYNSGTLIIAATNKGLFVSNDLAANYTRSNSGLTDSLHITSLVFGGGRLYASTQNAGIFVSADTGITWTSCNTGLTVHNIKKLITTNTFLFAATASGEIFSTPLISINWGINTGIPSGINPTSFATDGSSHIFLGTETQGVFMCMDNQSWSASNNGLTNLKVTALTVSGTTLFAGTTGGGIFKRELMGNWSVGGTGLPSQAMAITSLCASGQWVAAGFKGGVYITYDNGASWKAPNVTQFIPEYADITEISFTPSSTRIFVATPYNCLYSNSIAELPTGIYNVHADPGQIIVSPNPNNGHFTIALKDIKATVESIRIYDLSGKQVYESTDFRYRNSTSISLNDLSGMYFIFIQTDKGSLSKKLILN